MRQEVRRYRAQLQQARRGGKPTHRLPAGHVFKGLAVRCVLVCCPLALGLVPDEILMCASEFHVRRWEKPNQREREMKKRGCVVVVVDSPARLAPRDERRKPRPLSNKSQSILVSELLFIVSKQKKRSNEQLPRNSCVSPLAG